MYKRICALVFGLALLCGLALGEPGYKTVSATGTSQTINLGAASKVTIVNDGANEVYFRLFYGTEPPAAATTSSAYLASGASIEYGGPQNYGAISLVCDGAETATVRLYYQ